MDVPVIQPFCESMSHGACQKEGTQIPLEGAQKPLDKLKPTGLITDSVPIMYKNK